MSEKDYTPGPWHEGQGNGEGSIFAGEGHRMRFENGTTLYPVCRMVGGWEASEDAANARLVAASPELLEACEAAEHWLRKESLAEGKVQPDEIMLVLAAAIQQATGRESCSHCGHGRAEDGVCENLACRPGEEKAAP